MDAPQPRHQPGRRRALGTALAAAALAWLGLIAAPSAAGDPGGPDTLPPVLSLTAAQQQKLSALEAASHAQARQLFQQLRQFRGRLEDLYAGYAFDVAEARRLNRELNRVQGQLLDLRLAEQQQIRAVLSAAQFAQLQAAIRARRPDGDRPDGDEPWEDGRPDRGHGRHH